MKIKLIAYGIAKDILNERSLMFSIKESGSIKELKNALVERYPEFEKLVSLKLAVGEDYQEDSYILKEGEEVVVIPPVSGG